MRKTREGHRCMRGALPIAQAVSFRTLGRCPDGVITSPRSPFPAVSGRDAQQQHAVGGVASKGSFSLYTPMSCWRQTSRRVFSPHMPSERGVKPIGGLFAAVEEPHGQRPVLQRFGIDDRFARLGYGHVLAAPCFEDRELAGHCPDAGGPYRADAVRWTDEKRRPYENGRLCDQIRERVISNTSPCRPCRSRRPRSRSGGIPC